MIYCLFSFLNTVSLRSNRKECIQMIPLFLRVLLALRAYKVLLEPQEAWYHLSNFAFLLYLSLLFIKHIGNIRMACAILATNLPSTISNILKTTLNIMHVKTTTCIQKTLYTNTCTATDSCNILISQSHSSSAVHKIMHIWFTLTIKMKG